VVFFLVIHNFPLSEKSNQIPSGTVQNFCHPERSEGSLKQILRFVQNDIFLTNDFLSPPFKGGADLANKVSQAGVVNYSPIGGYFYFFFSSESPFFFCHSRPDRESRP